MKRDKLNSYSKAITTRYIEDKDEKICIECKWKFKPAVKAQVKCDECDPKYLNKKQRK